MGFSCRGLRSSETVQGPPGPPGLSGALVPGARFRGGLVAFGAPETFGSLPQASGGPPGGLRGASGVPPGASGGPREDFGGLEPFFGSGRWVW